MRSAQYAGQIVHVALANGTHELAPMVLDGSFGASEIRLEADPAVRPSVRLRPENTEMVSGRRHMQPASLPLFTLLSGAPLIRLAGLRLEGPLNVIGGSLQLANCTVSLNATGVASDSRALLVGGGVVHIEGTTFENNPAGAVQVIGGNMTMVGGWIQRNRASMGGAMHITGGRVLVASTLLEANEASISGGALQVEGGLVTLSDRTLLQRNAAPTGRSVELTAAHTLFYTLPAPLGRWIFALHGDTVSLDVGAVDAEFPFACNAGLVGNSYALAAQSSPLCADICATAKSRTRKHTSVIATNMLNPHRVAALQVISPPPASQVPPARFADWARSPLPNVRSAPTVQQV